KKRKMITSPLCSPLMPAASHISGGFSLGDLLLLLSKLKSNLRKRFCCVFEGLAKAGNPTLLNQIYTELYITEGGTGEAHDEHEVMKIETASRRRHVQENTIKQEHIFKGSPGKDKPIRTVMTKGVAGIGKTVLTQKFTLDWAESKTNQDILFIFPFAFRELNLLKEKRFSLVELVHHFFHVCKEAKICRFEKFPVLFIFDGLDECRLPLDFQNNEILTDITESASLDVLLTNLIGGKLLPSARLWITTRPAAASQIPPECVDTVTEVKGFTDLQKEEYFRKRFIDQKQAGRIISHMKTSPNLFIMCHIPVFCWINATVLEYVLKTCQERELPKSLTELYMHFLLVQTKVKEVKYDGGVGSDLTWSPESRQMIQSLGKLAFDQLRKGNLIFYESDLKGSGIDIRAASVYSGVFTQIFEEERGIYQDRLFCFIHLSVQEFLAALYIHLTFMNSGVNLLDNNQTPQRVSKVFKTKPNVKKLHQIAVDKALQSPNGHLDLVLRMLLGLSLPSNQTLLRGLQTQTTCSSQTNQETAEYIKKKIGENLSAEKSINLFHCLNELNDRSLTEEIQQYLRSGSLSTRKLSPAQWSALIFILLSSEEDLNVFHLKKYCASEDALLMLLPVVKASSKALLNNCSLSGKSCEGLSSVLSSQSCCLKEVDLSNNNLEDAGLKALYSGTPGRQCKLESLRLADCDLSQKSCETLSSFLSSKSSRLKTLVLNYNNLRDAGLQQLSDGLMSPYCRLETLRLSGCLVTGKGCAYLASALTSNHSYLTELDLSYNHPGLLGKQMLSSEQKGPLDHDGENRLNPDFRKYLCELEVDTYSVNRKLRLSDSNTQVRLTEVEQPYPNHPNRFQQCWQLMCRNGVTGRCYWEVEWKGSVLISASYKGIKRRGTNNECRFGRNDQSWTLECSDVFGFSAWHVNRETSILTPATSQRIGVFLDHPAGTLSFYIASSEALIHLHTFSASFTEPVYPSFGLWTGGSLLLRSAASDQPSA
uniref:NACHT, LRR and PYD domains-containing protein 12-like n=1 Tax=Fundulus heteroclitus TaxID=8078 RepID=A0A3Q2PJC0_FUNHE